MTRPSMVFGLPYDAWIGKSDSVTKSNEHGAARDPLQAVSAHLWGNWVQHKMADPATSETEALELARQVADAYRKDGLAPKDATSILRKIDERFDVLKDDA